MPLKAFIWFQGLFFALLYGVLLYFDLHFLSLFLGFAWGQTFALTSLWLGKRLFAAKINLATLGLMIFKWGVFGFILFLSFQKLDRVAFTVGMSGLLSFWLAFALGSKR